MKVVTGHAINNPGHRQRVRSPRRIMEWPGSVRGAAGSLHVDVRRRQEGANHTLVWWAGSLHGQVRQSLTDWDFVATGQSPQRAIATHLVGFMVGL